MRFLGVVVAALAVFSVAPTADAQSIASIGGPKELPPSSFTGQQYVDSRGCVFLKAGYGGQVNWVPRVNGDRKAMCGLPPTFAEVQIETAEQEPAPVVAAVAPAIVVPKSQSASVDPAIYTPAPVASSRGQATQAVPPRPVAATRVASPAPYSDTAPRSTAKPVSGGPGPGKIGCFTSAPVAEVVRLSDGRTAVVCTRGDGTMTGWRPPIYPAGSPVGVALGGSVAPVSQNRAQVAVASSDPAPALIATVSVPKPPKGYKLAWTDDRLNPKRAQGTAAGQAAQDQVWTRDVPARRVVAKTQTKQRVTVSTKSRDNASTPSGPFVQIGSFGVVANAERAAAKVAGLGLPVAKGRTTKGGTALHVVFAGPFASATDAQAALSRLRQSGFPDAILR